MTSRYKSALCTVKMSCNKRRCGLKNDSELDIFLEEVMPMSNVSCRGNRKKYLCLNFERSANIQFLRRMFVLLSRYFFCSDTLMS